MLARCKFILLSFLLDMEPPPRAQLLEYAARLQPTFHRRETNQHHPRCKLEYVSKSGADYDSIWQKDINSVMNIYHHYWTYWPPWPDVQASTIPNSPYHPSANASCPAGNIQFPPFYQISPSITISTDPHYFEIDPGHFGPSDSEFPNAKSSFYDLRPHSSVVFLHASTTAETLSFTRPDSVQQIANQNPSKLAQRFLTPSTITEPNDNLRLLFVHETIAILFGAISLFFATLAIIHRRSIGSRNRRRSRHLKPPKPHHSTSAQPSGPQCPQVPLSKPCTPIARAIILHMPAIIMTALSACIIVLTHDDDDDMLISACLDLIMGYLLRNSPHRVKCYFYFIILASTIPVAQAMDTQSKDYARLINVDLWDGNPSVIFRATWYKNLRVALGGVVQDGFTLLSCATSADTGHGRVPVPGDPVGPPIVPAVTDDDITAHWRRCHRLAAMILGKIENGSYIHAFLSTDPGFNPIQGPDGRAMYVYLHVWGHIPRPHPITEELRNRWEEGTLLVAVRKIDDSSLLKYYNWIQDLAQPSKLNKSNRQQYDRFLTGMPPAFDPIVASERTHMDTPTWTIPANYPAHHPLRGQGHPHHGQPDVLAMVKAYVPEWIRMIKQGIIKRTPKGMVHEAREVKDHEPVDDQDDKSSDDESDGGNSVTDHEFIKAVKTQMRPTSRCNVCGGLGHWARVGDLTCLTAQLKIKVPDELLDGIKYPPPVEAKPKRVKAVLPKKKPTKGKFIKRKPKQVKIANELEYDSYHESSSDNDDDEDAEQISTVEVHDVFVTTSSYNSLGGASSSRAP